MRIMSLAKSLVVTLAFISALAMPWSVPAASAKAMKPMKLPPGAGAVEKKAVNAGTILPVPVQRADQLVRAAVLQQRHAGPGPALFRSVLRAEMRGLRVRS
jgi:hypothetical protein